MESPRIGFVGFGEAGSLIAKGLAESGVDAICAFDIHTATAARGEVICNRARAAGVELVETREQLTERSRILISTVTADVAETAVCQFAPNLGPAHLYADLNSVSPQVKRKLETVVIGRGARFVEGAIMASVPPHGHRVPILLGGAAAPDFRDLMTPYGMQLELASLQVGAAAATKMLRSIVIKGMEALLVECMLGAQAYAAEEKVFASLAESFPGIDWAKMADYMIRRVAVHGERRAREMEEVCETLRAVDVSPTMSAATARLMDWSAHFHFTERFDAGLPGNRESIIDVLLGK
ncbi:MAG TPA: DUF1932 domain-containing protein [Bryobacteraceae bacterium]|jgi:3-hydroxyisobutyrate dehydrogenase-like beta-hydroxyacid dehydrogenase|nr:DUF1932 domain-containing protein [Bryobacteraceae bacterium]